MAQRQELPRTQHDHSLRPRLWRSQENKVFAGVIGGIAERLDVNPTMLRWFAAFTDVFTGFIPGIVLYLIVWAIASPYPGDRGISRGPDRSSGVR